MERHDQRVLGCNRDQNVTIQGKGYAMDDIYEERPSHDFADGFAAGVILGKEFGSSTDGADEDGLYVNNEARWKDFAPKKKGLSGLIAFIVRVNTILYIAVSIGILVVLGIIELLKG